MELFIYFLGWIIWIIGYYIFEVYIDKNYKTKKLVIYKGFTSGFTSWLGIIFIISFLIIKGIIELNNWIENKLSK